jgi:2-dehydropantoate 2-reductase
MRICVFGAGAVGGYLAARLLKEGSHEIAAIAAAGGVDLLDQVQIAKEAPKLGASIGGSSVTGMRPSMLQDALSGRAMEVEAILGQVQEFARATGTPCPVLDVLLPLAPGLNHHPMI